MPRSVHPKAMIEDEAHWIPRARAGDALAFRRLVDANAGAMFRVCARITGDRTLAEDAVQEALLNAFRHLPDFDGRSAFSTWLYRIAVNAALVQVRKRRYLEVPWPERTENDEAVPMDAADESPTPDRQAVSAEIRRDVEAELSRMTAIERAAFVLRHQEGRSLEEISAALSLNVSAAKQAIFRAVRKLRAALEAPGEPA
jgi:RNA polymerase sigma-70 factor (ECF subfamily)